MKMHNDRTKPINYLDLQIKKGMLFGQKLFATLRLKKTYMTTKFNKIYILFFSRQRYNNYFTPLKLWKIRADILFSPRNSFIQNSRISMTKEYITNKYLFS